MDAAGAVDAQNAPTALGKPHRPRFPTAPTRIVDFKEKKDQNGSRQPASHTKFLTLPFAGHNRIPSNPGPHTLSRRRDRHRLRSPQESLKRLLKVATLGVISTESWPRSVAAKLITLVSELIF